MAAIVYLLCLATSLACGALLLRAHRRTRAALLLWSGLCFVGLAVDNALLFLDLVVVPHIDLSTPRNLIGLLSFTLLLLGLILEA
jgi:hypothetical protein